MNMRNMFDKEQEGWAGTIVRQSTHPVTQLREEAVIEDGTAVRGRASSKQVLQGGVPQPALRRLLSAPAVVLRK